ADRAARPGTERRAPLPEEPIRDAADVDAGQVSTDDERRPARVEAASVRGPELSATETFDRLTFAARGPVVRRPAAVDRRGEGLIRSPAGVGLGLEEVVQPLVAKAVDLGLGERRPQDDLGEKLQGR